jgi:cellulose synthase/poly-beta-1,6-N-acetylglucosamine synthase-like glycosyltransferase
LLQAIQASVRLWQASNQAWEFFRIVSRKQLRNFLSLMSVYLEINYILKTILFNFHFLAKKKHFLLAWELDEK